ncbi:MAG: hypothetical protein JSS10_03680 [Verrucomicrobia bacterium]|nr:hypothetical protein [Verrucomicrobiota bacterium]
MPVTLKDINFKLPPVELPAPILGSPWLGKLISPLHAPAFTFESVAEIAERVKYIGLASLVFLIAIAIRWATAGNTKPVLSAEKGKTEQKEDPASIVPTPQPGAPEPTAEKKALESTIGADGQKLDQLFGEISKDILNVSQEAYRDFESRVAFFLKKYAEVAERYRTLFATIKGNIEVIRYFARIKQGIILAQPDKGNCFFEAVRNGLEFLNIEVPKDHSNMRQQVVTWMRAKLGTDAKLQQYIRDGIEAFIQDKLGSFKAVRKGWEDLGKEGIDVGQALKSADSERDRFVEETKLLLHPVDCFEEYFKRIDQPGFFASDAEFYAVSEMYQLPVHIQVSFNGTEPEYNRSFGENYRNPNRYLTIVHKDGKHFDLRKPITE